MEGSGNGGVVEIKYRNIWGRVCMDGWDVSDAQVVCRELGYTNGMAYTHFR